ncbi:MAG: WecB/TagA/CpsF family glycosyltransferase [Verrucomicrobiales bacterium]|nr:WecB/TagA/CpsF family glycosyltransferase [Verrucomicrobiales bacterium]
MNEDLKLAIDDQCLEKRVNVLGVGISPINLDTAFEIINAAIRSELQGYVGVTGVHGVTEAQSDSSFKQILNNTFLNTPDGMPMVWYGKILGHEGISRVYGPDLMLRICSESVENGIRHFFFGGREGVAEKLRDKLTKKFPGLEVVGTYTPPFRPLSENEERSVRDIINSSGAHCVWVGLSTPKQEKFMSKILGRFGKGGDRSFEGAKIFFGVGAAFDFHAGLIPQAPSWLQSCGMEWFYRLCKEPKRLWRRYLKNNPLFIIRAILQLLNLRNYPLRDADEH